MNAQEAILKIRALFEDAQVPVAESKAMPMDKPAKLEAIEYSLEDGTKVMIDKLEIGGIVANSDGSPVVAGELKLADGTSIQIDDKGSIIEVASPAEDMQPEEMPVAEMKNKMAELQAEFQAKVDILNFEKEELQNKLKALTEKTSQGFTQVLNLISDMSKVPSADPIAKPNSFKYQDTKDLKYERMEKYRQAILNNKN
jgi:hypothetical protein